MHNNSLKAYYEEKPKLSKRSKDIYNFFKENERMYTDREVQLALGFSEPNQVRPRITELIKTGMLTEMGKTKCKYTNKTVREVVLLEERRVDI
tara:strand:- start:342 stop:620 length:279 start_codon:yes stop_codon:yes gene_type:complete